jgi:hypothetical protein
MQCVRRFIGHSVRHAGTIAPDGRGSRRRRRLSIGCVLPTAPDGGESRAPLAVVIMGGVISSTLLTLVLVPAVYTILDDLKVSLGHLTSHLPRLAFGSRPKASAGWLAALVPAVATVGRNGHDDGHGATVRLSPCPERPTSHPSSQAAGPRSSVLIAGSCSNVLVCPGDDGPRGGTRASRGDPAYRGAAWRHERTGLRGRAWHGRLRERPRSPGRCRYQHIVVVSGGLIVNLEELLGCRVDVATETTLHRRIRDRVLAEAHPL